MRMSNKYRPYMKSPCTTLFEHPFKVHPSSKINPYGFEKVDITRITPLQTLHRFERYLFSDNNLIVSQLNDTILSSSYDFCSFCLTKEIAL